jgi:hypothetical protein
MAEKHEVHQYGNIYDAPEAWRTLNGARLTLKQVNWITKRAQELGTKDTINVGAARAEFRESHVVKDNQWVQKNSGPAKETKGGK